MENKNEADFWSRLEAIIFPLLAAVIGIGYCVAILSNNRFDNVIASPHALIFLFIFAAIAFFPIKSLFRFLIGKTEKPK